MSRPLFCARVDGRLQAIGSDVGGEHACPEASEVQGELAPESLAGAGDDHAFVGQARFAHDAATAVPSIMFGRSRSMSSGV